MNERVNKVKEMSPGATKAFGIGLVAGIIFAFGIYFLYPGALIVLTAFVAGLFTGILYPANEEDSVQTSAMTGAVLMGLGGLLFVIWVALTIPEYSITTRILIAVIGGIIAALSSGIVGALLGGAGGVVGRLIGLIGHAVIPKTKKNNNTPLICLGCKTPLRERPEYCPGCGKKLTYPK
jgi:hypothetical protein